MTTQSLVKPLITWPSIERMLARQVNTNERFKMIVVYVILLALFYLLSIVYVPRLSNVYSADVIVVLGHPANNDGTPSEAIQEEVILAASLCQNNMADVVVLAGSSVRNEHVEAEVMSKLAVSVGIPQQSLILERRSQDTIENAMYVKEIMVANKWNSAIIITTPYHARRASFIFHRHKINHQVTYSPSSYEFQSAGTRVWSLAYEIAGICWLLFSRLFDIKPFWGINWHSWK